MSNSVTHLDLLDFAAEDKETIVNDLADAGSPIVVFGRRASQTALLVWGWYGGTKLLGSKPTQFGNNTLTLTNSATNYVYEVDGVVAKVTAAPTGWPGPITSIANATALYQITVSGGVVTAFTDYRTFVQNLNLRIATPASATNMTLDWDAYDMYRITMAHNITFTFSGGADGGLKLLELKQDATGTRVPVWPATVRFSGTLPAPTLTVTANRLDKLAFRRRVVDTKYDIEAINLNFA